MREEAGSAGLARTRRSDCPKPGFGLRGSVIRRSGRRRPAFSHGSEAYRVHARQVSPDPDPPVARRILFYLPGYDPDGEHRYRTLFLREIRRYARIFGIRSRGFPAPSRARTG